MLDYTLHKDIPVPLYYQLKLQLLADIQEGRLHVGDMIPPECEISKVLHVSRPTVRQALTELVAEGHLVRFKGKGTFVSEPLRPPVDARFFQGAYSGLLPEHFFPLHEAASAQDLQRLLDAFWRAGNG